MAGGVEGGVQVGEEVALLRLAGRWIVGGEVRGHSIVEEQVALRHVLAEVALHHTGVDEVFEEGGGCGAGSGIGFGKDDKRNKSIEHPDFFRRRNGERQLG